VLFLGVAPPMSHFFKISTPFMDLSAESRSPMVLPVFFMKAVAVLESEAIYSSRLWCWLILWMRQVDCSGDGH
jgi:hypothetical protein